jgi:hypothetical protein
LSSWNNNNEHTAWIIKHASRTLIKKGNPESLALFGFEKNAGIKLEKLKISKPELKLGDEQEFKFNLISEKNKTQKLVIDYAIYYTKKSGEQSPKIFKLKEIDLKPLSKVTISKKHSFKDFSTRKHDSGKHALEIRINGKMISRKEFKLSV